jgi:hypothetical protein
VTLKTLRGGKTPALFKKSIDWFYWKNMQSVNSWEASSLVCGIDPLDNSKHEQREKIHALIYSNAGNRAFFSMLYVNDSQRFLLSEVAAWCLSIGFPIPDELMLLANTHEKNLKVAPPTDTEPTEKALNPSKEKTYLHTIGALLEYIKGDITGVKSHPNFGSEADMIATIEDNYRDRQKQGLKMRSLQTNFAVAKAKLNEK